LKEQFNLKISDKRVERLQQQVYNARLSSLKWELKTLTTESQLPAKLNIGFLTNEHKEALLAELTTKGYNVESEQSVPRSIPDSESETIKPSVLLKQHPHTIILKK
jgi:uncharacterized protein YfcZ (UPF0381/DUF406 family)